MTAPTSRNSSRIEGPMIVGDCAGTIVVDFEALMDFVAGGVRSAGKYHLLPMARLNELDELMTVERGEPVEGKNWCVAKIEHTRFGDEVLTTIFGEIQRSLFSEEHSDRDFGVWRPLFQHIFPQWINHLKFPEPEFRDGIYYFKVSLGRPWRRIAIAAESSLDELAECIIRAFDFDGDHLYEFRIAEQDGKILTIEHPNSMDADLHTDEFAIGYLTLEEGQSMPFLYDFGADWKFTVQLEQIKSPDAEITIPIIVESHGEAPAEYDDEW